MILLTILIILNILFAIFFVIANNRNNKNFEMVILNFAEMQEKIYANNISFNKAMKLAFDNFNKSLSNFYTFKNDMNNFSSMLKEMSNITKTNKIVFNKQIKDLEMLLKKMKEQEKQ